jgi:hypothetical protein
MGEPVVQAATERGGRIRLSQTGGVRRWKGPIRGKDLDTPSWNGKDGFVHDTEMRGIGLVVSELRTPSVIQNDGVTTHLDGVGWSTLAGFVLRNGDQTFRPGPEMGASFPTEERDPLLGNSNVDKHHAVHSFEGHEHQQFRKFKAVEAIHVKIHHAKFIWLRGGHRRIRREGVGGHL